MCKSNPKKEIRETTWRTRWCTPEGIHLVVVETTRRVYEERKDGVPMMVSKTKTYQTEGGQKAVIQTKGATCQVMTARGPVHCVKI